ncbi:hypothetical protein HA466_0024870 [Hirschfeldia incana]|nr:hypothetical protein HA466_0024870 [Hirschfeldia incana]
MADSIDKMGIETCKVQDWGSDLVEIRLDSLQDFNPLEDLKTIIQKSPLATLFTCRFVCVCTSVGLLLCDIEHFVFTSSVF